MIHWEYLNGNIVVQLSSEINYFWNIVENLLNHQLANNKSMIHQQLLLYRQLELKAVANNVYVSLYQILGESGFLLS